MKICRIVAVSLFLLASFSVWGQQGGSDVVVDYNRPKKYIVGGVGVEGNTYFSSEQILQNAGLHEGMEVTVPGEDMTMIVSRGLARETTAVPRIFNRPELVIVDIT